MKSVNFNDYLQFFALGMHFELWDVFSFLFFGVRRNEWYHKSGRSRFIPVRVRIQRARASNFDFGLVFVFFVILHTWILRGVNPPLNLSVQKNKKLKNLFKIKVWSASSLNKNPYGDKSTTARFVVPFIPSYAKHSKTEHNPRFKVHTQYKKL